MATPIFRYPLDPTGVNPDNLVVREPKELSPKSNPTDVRVTCPLYGPFYADSLVILDSANGRALAKDEYQVTDLLSNPTLSFGQEIAQFIVITNGSVSNNIEISYQVLGGNYQNDSTAVQHVFETFLNDTRPVDWSNVSGKPATFPPSLHLHLLQDIVNFGPLVVAIDSLRQAMLLNNTPMFEALIDFVLKREINWTAITNKPTTIQGFGITNGVTTNTAQTITGEKTFGIVHLGTNSDAANPDAPGRSKVATDGQVQRAEARLVPKTTRVVPGLGMSGGGALQDDVTMTLGTPGDLTLSSLSVAGPETHTHKVNVASLSGTTSDTFANGADLRILNAVPNTTEVIAGDGLTGGGPLNGNITMTLAPPMTINGDSENTVTANGHTHKFDMAALAGGLLPTVYRNMIGSRRSGGLYYNTTNTFRMVNVSAHTERYGWSTLVAYVNGAIVQQQRTSYDHPGTAAITFMVPPGASYAVTVANSINVWSELSTPDSTD